MIYALLYRRDVLFLGLTPIYYKQPYLFYDLKKLIYATDRAMNEVELDNSVNIYKAADALLIFLVERCRQDGRNHKFKRPEATVIFHKEIKLFIDDPIYFRSYHDAGV